MELYHLLLEEVKRFGPYELHPAKSRIALNNKMRFASVNRLGRDFIDVHLVFTRRFDDTLCFHKIETITKTAHIHHFRLYSKEDITEELKHYLKLAYIVGTRKHLEKNSN